MKPAPFKNILLTTALMIGLFTQCSVTPKVVTEQSTPFKVMNATYQYIQENPLRNSNIKLDIVIDRPVVRLDSIYFRGRRTALYLSDPNIPTGFTGIIKSVPHKNIVLHKDATMEYGNVIPMPRNKLPFDLKENEAVIRYQYLGKVHFFLIPSLKKIP